MWDHLGGGGAWKVLSESDVPSPGDVQSLGLDMWLSYSDAMNEYIDIDIAYIPYH